ncbi:MAG: small multi-drug export protein [Clostridia bacterium]|nr:small multi-drug export protein [Clostridia bacterium]
MAPALQVFLLSMVPVLELRAAIPFGYALGLPLGVNFALCVLGNFLPVPFILLFIKRILQWMKGVKHLDKIALWLESKAEKNSSKVMKGVALGLFLFVAIPFPGTGAWTGSLVASLFDMRMKYALPAVFLGIVGAALIMSLLSYGLVGGILTIFA